MTDYDKYPRSDDPADPPPPPRDEQCPKVPPTKPPDYKPPETCKPDCKCPPGPAGGEHCLEDLIEAQTQPITSGDKAKAFKTELEAFLGKARAARDEYTREKYDKLVKIWQDQDREIVELIRKLVCDVSCWRCIIECYVCPLLYEMRDAELQLYGDGKWCSEAHDRQDLLYWHTRDRAEKERFFNRIKNLLAVWEKPAQTIEKILGDNATLISNIKKSLGTEPTKAIYDVFLKLIPLHLAIAPLKPTTNIDPKYTEFCSCDDREPILCCGIDVGEPSVRERIIGPQPKLIEPKDYFDLICCLVKNVYLPAKDRLSLAEAAVTTAENIIKRLKLVIDDGLKNFDKRARAAIPTTVTCAGETIEVPPTKNGEYRHA